jgi:hypothetical protein
MIVNGSRVLITTDEFFCAPDGNFYRCIYGRAWIHKFEEALGFKPQGHANWMVRICRDEDNENGVTLAGCRVNYFVKMDTPPNIIFSNQVATNNGLLFYPNIYIVKD